MKLLKPLFWSFAALLLLSFSLMPTLLQAQVGKYDAFFEEAYQKHPTVPRGLLEAVAYTNTRMHHVQPRPSCQEVPTYYGVMGLVEDGKGYFKNSLQQVSELSGYRVEEIKRDPRINILAYAAAYSVLQANKRLANQRVESHKPILRDLSEIPLDGDVRNDYALDLQFYGVLDEMQQPHTGVRSRRVFNYDEIFGRENYRVLSADRVMVEQTKVRSLEGDNFTSENAALCTSTGQTPDYAGALFVPAHPRNYGSRDGIDIEYVTVHTVQGSYASAIAWFKNRNARVSAHYIIRASDGQITQMVCEKDKAYHVKTDNAGAIGIEHEGFIDDGLSWYTNEAYESSAALVRDICERYDIDPRKTFSGPPTNGIRTLSNTCYKIKGHQHFRGNNHIDPGPFWDWERYYRLINPEPSPETFTARRGRIYDSGGEDGNYADLQRKAYLIQPENVEELTLTFETFDLEGTNEVPFDFLDIYDGSSSAGRYLGRFSGNQPPGPLKAYSGAFFIEFRSDCQVNQSGFVLRYSAERGQADCQAPQNVVVSELFPMGATLSWDAVASAQEYLVYVQRRTFEDRWTKFSTRENRLVLTGLSANAIYNVQLRSVCNGDTSAITGQTLQTPNTSRDGRAQIYTLRVNQGRFFDSGGQAAGYGDNEVYLYRIIPPDGGRVELRFSSFNTEAEHDQLTIYDGLNISSAPNLGTFSGDQEIPNVISSGNGLTVMFKSDNRTNADGWVAYWRSVGGGNHPPPTDPEVPIRPDPTPNPTDPVTPPVSANFEANLKFPRTAPRTEPELEDRYSRDFTLEFDDDDNSGRGLANRFYSVAYQSPAGWQANYEAGFFFDDFESGLRSLWTAKAGNWKVENGVLTQSNLTLTNTNLYADLNQTGDEVYLYHWLARMTGETGNRRHGIHFFASDPDQPDRGTSYFVWIRESDRGDFLEIYKTVNDQFDRKVRRPVTIADGEVHDYKAIYNPDKGRIEVYINNEFGGAWVDPYPLKEGRALSLRSGNCVVSYDDIEVFHARGRSVRIGVGEGRNDLLRDDRRFRVSSLIVDRNIDWSPVTQGFATVGAGTPDPRPSDPDPGPTQPTPTGNTGLAASYRDDFQVQLGGVGETFFLPADYDGDWGANRQLGFAYDAFAGNRLDPVWQAQAGSWRVRDGYLQQTDPQESNSNLFVALEQDNEQAYLYHFRARMRSEGDNHRFGLHFFCSEGNQSNRGDSYLMWFRFNQTEPGRVEVYRAENNQLPRWQESAIATLQPNQWYDVKIVYRPSTGEIETYLNDQLALRWRDPKPHRSGSYLSFRTGNALVEFDDLRVYQAATTNPLQITVGRREMLRYEDQARLLLVTLNGSVWSRVLEQSTRIR